MLELHDRLVPIETAAEILAVSKQTVFRMLDDGLLHSVKIRGSRRVRVSDLNALIAGGRQEAV
jgi:excisionase family DNA binding protein